MSTPPLPSLLAADEAPPSFAARLHRRQRAASAMDLAWQEGIEHGEAFLVGQQWAGRGRRGRAWASAHHLGAWWACRLRLTACDGLPTLPLLAALVARAAVAQLLAGQLGTPPAQRSVVAEVKWPNDILVAGGKVAGVLVESRSLGDQAWAVVGIGINLEPPRGVPSRPCWPAGGLLRHLPVLPPQTAAALPDRLGTALMAQLQARWPAWQRDGWAALAAPMRAHLALVGERIWVHRGGQRPWQAQVQGCGPDGRLRVAGPQGRCELVDGELRPTAARATEA